MSSNGRKPAKSSQPPGYHDAGHVVPIQLTVRQQAYCRRAIGIARFTYNLCVATHQFCRTNRLPWPSWQDLNKAVNETKQHDFPFLAEVSHRVVDGAVRDFGQAIDNWRNPELKARQPTFKKRRLTSSGSFRAAGAVREIRYDGKRRIKLPYLGSVKLAHTLPAGIFYEARISFRNGQWLLSLNYWKTLVGKPEQDNRILAGGADTGLTPHATDSEGQTWANPKAYYRAERKLRRWQRAQARRTKNSRGWWEAQRRIDRLYRRINGLRKEAQHRMTSELVHKYQHLVIEDINIVGLMQGKTPKAQADAGMGEIKTPTTLQGPVASLRRTAGTPVLPVQQDVLQLSDRERETQAGTLLAVPVLRHRARAKRKRSGQPAVPGGRKVGSRGLTAGYAPRREGSGPPKGGRNRPG